MANIAPAAAEQFCRKLRGHLRPGDLFDHFPIYDPGTGSCKSYLISMADQVVTFPTTGNEIINFAKEEAIFTEISQKYTVDQVRQLGEHASFETVTSFFDSQGWFIDTLWLVS